MKMMKSLLLLALAGFSTLASAKTIEMDVNGLVCAFCAQGIEKTLKGFPATEGVFVSLEHGLVAVHLKDGQDIGDAALRKAITDAGYKLVAIRRTDAELGDIKARVGKHKGKAVAKPKGEDGHAHGKDGAHEHDGTKHD